MAQKDPIESAFNEALGRRVRELRLELVHPNGRRWTQGDMADTLGISEEQYRKYEWTEPRAGQKRQRAVSPIPHYLIPRLARICKKSIEYVLTGREPVQLRIVS